MEQKQVKPTNKKRKVIIAVCSSLGAVAAIGAGLGIGYAIFKDKEADVEHEITVDASTETHGYGIKLSKKTAKKGETIRIDVTKSAVSNTTYQPKAIRITSTGQAGPSEYSLIPNGTNAYYANVQILYTSNMKVSLLFDTLEDWVVTFDVNGGKTTIAQQTVARGQKVTRPIVDPQKDGSTFKYWYVEDGTGTQAAFDFDTIIQGNITLKAKWQIDTHTVTWKNDDAAGTILYQHTFNYGDTPVYGGSTPTKQSTDQYDYIFAGWDTKILPVTQDVVYTATYTNKLRAYTVNFHNGDHGSTPSSVSANYGATISQPTATDVGYTIEGWYTESTFANKWTFNTSTVKGPTELYAKWDVNKYKVGYDLAGGEGTYSPTQVDYNSTIAKPADPTRTGYTFGGWTVDGSLWDFDNNKVTKNITLVASWTSKQYCVVTFNPQNGESVTTQSVEAQQTVAKPTDPTREGYTFDGWYTAATGGTKVETWPQTITANTSFYAHWIAKTYTVTFHNGTTETPVTVNHGDKVQRPTNPTPTAGKKFVGWVKTSGGSELFDFDTAIEANTDIYAKFADCEAISVGIKTFPAKTQYTVGETFESTGLEVEATLEDGSTTVVAAGEGTGKYTIDSSAFSTTTPGTYPITVNYKVSDAKTLTSTFYVYVKQKVITATFNTNYVGGPTYSVTLEAGNAVSQPLDPSRDGYIFKGWYEDAAGSTAFDFSTKLTADKILYAKWEQAFSITEPTTSTDREVNGFASSSSWTLTEGETIRYRYTFPGVFKLGASANGYTPSDLTVSGKMTYAVEPATYTMTGEIIKLTDSTFQVSLYKDFTYGGKTETSQMFELDPDTELTVSDLKIATDDGKYQYKCTQSYKGTIVTSLLWSSETPVLELHTDAYHSLPYLHYWVQPINAPDKSLWPTSWYDTVCTYTVKDTTNWALDTDYNHSGWSYYDQSGFGIRLYTLFTALPAAGTTTELGFELLGTDGTTVCFKKEIGKGPAVTIKVPEA